MKTENQKRGYALITGGTSGIGYEIARCFAKDGHDLVLVARSQESLMEVKTQFEEEYGIQVQTISKDLMVPGAAKEIYQQIKNNGMDIEYLVNDAGQGYWGKFAETELDREIDLINLNIVALVSLTKYFLADMLKRNSGRILQVASQLSKAPSPYMSVYGASKAFVLSFHEALRQEIKDSKVTMTALLPGATDTDFFHKAGALDSVEYKEKSLYDPEEVAHAAYEALMDGDEKVMPGLKNKIQGGMGTVMPDTMVAANMEKHMKESHKEGGKNQITHARSAEEREQINSETGKSDGDRNKHEGHVHESRRAQ
jgi:uncharacterized protein